MGWTQRAQWLVSNTPADWPVTEGKPHHAEAGPELVHVLRVVEQDEDHHPLQQVLH